MKGYGYYHKRKNVKLRVFFAAALAVLLGYILVKNINWGPLFQSRETDYKWISSMLSSFDSEKDRMEKRVLLNKIAKRVNKVFANSEDVHESQALYFLGSVNLRRALLEYNKELRNMYLDKAVYYYRKALAFVKEDKGLSAIHFELGKSYFYKGDYYYYESLLELETAVKLGYSRDAADKIIQFIRSRSGDITEIDELVNNFKNSKDGSVENLFYDAFTYKNNRDFHKAEEAFRGVLDHFSRNPLRTEEDKYIYYRSVYALGWLSFNKKEYREALENYKKVLSYDTANADVFWWLGKTQEALKNGREARKMWEKVLELDPHNQNAKNKLKKLKAR